MASDLRILVTVDIRPGDTIIVESDKPLTVADRNGIEARIAKELPGVKCLVLNGLRMGGKYSPAALCTCRHAPLRGMAWDPACPVHTTNPHVNADAASTAPAHREPPPTPAPPPKRERVYG